MAELRAYIQQLRKDPSLNEEQTEIKIAEFLRNGAPEPVPEPVEEVSEPEPVPEPIEEVSEPEPVDMDTDEPEVEEIA